MDINADFGLLGPVLGGLALLIAVDTILGSISAVQGGAFKFEYLYAVIQTKGAAFVRVATLLIAGAATNWLEFSALGMDSDPFTLLGVGFATTLAASLLASIMGNIGSADTSAPQGVAPVNVAAPSDKV